ncbi:WD40 repeat-like protein [Neocallimastix sp. 'constans']
MEVCYPYIAVAMQTSENIPLIEVFDVNNVKKKKILYGNETSTEFINVAFSNDKACILAQSGEPDWLLYFWLWNKGKKLSIIKTSNNYGGEIIQIAVNNYETSMVIVSVIGTSILRVYRYVENALKLVNQVRTEYKCVCHTWVNKNRIVIGTENKKILIYENGEFIGVIDHYVIPNGFANISDHLDNISKINVITPFSTGFAVGNDYGIISIFEKTEDSEGYYKKNHDEVLESSAVKSMAVHVNKKGLLVTLQNNQVYYIQVYVDIEKNIDQGFEHLILPFHDGSIIDMDTCIWKPIIVTCGSDKTIRIWNYRDNFVEIIKKYEFDPICLSLHPNGLFLLVGFHNSVKIMTILHNDLYEHWSTNIIGCVQCKFSYGGQFYAIIHGSTIHIYSSWTYSIIWIIRGHTSKVRSICWSNDDRKLFSCDVEGTICVWNIPERKRENILTVPGQQFINGVFTPDYRYLYILEGSGKIWKFDDKNLIYQIPQNLELNNLCISNSGNILIGSTNTGEIRIIHINQDNEQAISFYDLSVHSGQITKLAISNDDSLIFSCSKDGCIAIINLRENNDEIVVTSPKQIAKKFNSNEMLITKSDLQSTIETIMKLTNKVNIMIQKKDEEIENKKKENDDQMKLLNENYEKTVKNYEKISEQIKQELTENNIKYQNAMFDNKEKKEKEINDIKSNFKTKINNENEKYKNLEKQIEKVEVNWKEEIQSLKDQHVNKIQYLKDMYQKKIEEKNQAIALLKKEIKDNEQIHNGNLSEIDENSEKDAIKIQYIFENKIIKEKEILEKVKLENIDMKTQYNEIIKEINYHKQNLATVTAEEKKLQNVIHNLENDIENVKQEMNNRDDTIHEKEKRIYDLQKKNHELEKFKFVLEYKLSELKKQIEPRENELVKSNTQYSQMSEELRQYQYQYILLDSQKKNVQIKYYSKKDEYKDYNNVSNFYANLLKKIRQKLIEAKVDINDPRKLKKHVLEFHKSFIDNYSMFDPYKFDDEKNMMKKYRFYQLSEDMLKKKIKSIEKKRDLENKSTINEGNIIIREIDNLRKEIIEKRIEIANLEKEIEKYNRQISAQGQRKMGKHEKPKLLPEIPRENSLITSNQITKKELTVNRNNKSSRAANGLRDGKKSRPNSKSNSRPNSQKNKSNKINNDNNKDDLEHNITIDPKTNNIEIYD